MNREIVMVETRWARRLDEVIANASRLLESELASETHGPGELHAKSSETVSSGAITNDAIRERLDDAARQEEKRRRLLKALSDDAPAWNSADHPDIDAAGGAAAWVKRLRHETEQAFRKRTGARKRK